PGRLFLDAHDLLDRLLAPRAGLDRVVVGHDADGTASDRADAGDNAVGGRVGLDIAGEQPVLLELGAGIEEELEPVAHEELALGPKLVAVAGVALLDPGAFLAVALLARAHRVVAPIPAWGPPITAGLFDCAWMCVETSARLPRMRRTLKLTAPPFTLCGVTSSRRSP